ncbi:MAG: glycosyltransferase [Pyrinomonadaceae bacterium]
MRVLHFLDSTNRGGAETIALDVCRNARMDLTFVTARGGALEEDFRNSGADFIKLKRRLPIDFLLVRNLRKIIEERKIEIVQGYQAVEGIHLYLATLGLRVKKVLSFQGGTFYDWKNKNALNFLIPRMNANIVVSKGLKKWHAQVDEFDTKNFTVIYNGADEKRLKPSGKNLKKELGLDESVLLVGMIGNFYREPRKDQLTICKSLRGVFAEIENAHCVFAGRIEAGAEEKFAACVRFCKENNIADRVHFLGARTDVPDILDALDLFIFSSFHEGLPVAVAEAMLAKVPMIVSNIEPLLEASSNGKYAEVFEVQNAGELAEKTLKLLKNDSVRKDLANRAYKFAVGNFSIEAHLQELKKLYEKILSE